MVTRAMINKMWAQQEETLGSVERDGVGDLFNLPQDELHDLVESAAGKLEGPEKGGERPLAGEEGQGDWLETDVGNGSVHQGEGELGRAEGHMTLPVSRQQLVET